MECNGTFDCPKGVQSSLNYSVDGVDQGGLPWSLDPNSIAIPSYYTIDGSFQLPHLSNGPHQLSIGIDEELYNGSTLISRNTWVNTVYFTVESIQPTSTLTPTVNPTATPTSSPTVPEFSLLAIFPFIIATLLMAVVLRHRKTVQMYK